VTAPPFQLPPGGVVIGLGCDVIEVERVKGVVERQGERFLARVFTPEERAYCLAKANPYPHLAARFAAKEAISKCFTTGIGGNFGWKTASVARGERQEPWVVLDEAGRNLLAQIGGTRVLVSLSHTQTVAMAVAAIVRQ
jgi:holo-[acyl-carrier protein] synthase